MNWNDPNWVAAFGAQGQCLGAIASLLAVIVAVGIAIWSARQTYKQSQQSRYDSARPVLVVSSHHDGRLFPLHVQPGLSGWLDWNNPIQSIWVKNVGTGTAFNMMSVLYGPESLAENNKLIPAHDNEHWSRKVSSLSINECGLCDHHRGSSMFFNGYTEVGGYRLLAPPQPLNYATTLELACICRVTITYQDIFKRKHASIFDLDVTGGWTMKAVLEEIPKDLSDLNRRQQPPQPPLPKRFKRFVIAGEGAIMAPSLSCFDI